MDVTGDAMQEFFGSVGMATGEDAVRRLMPPDCAPVEVDVEVAYHDEPADELWALEPHAIPVSLVHY